MTYHVYMLECADGTLYVGITNNLDRRVRQHNTAKEGARYTKTRRPVVLKYSEECDSKSRALKREIEIKSWSRGRKLALVKGLEGCYKVIC